MSRCWTLYMKLSFSESVWNEAAGTSEVERPRSRRVGGAGRYPPPGLPDRTPPLRRILPARSRAGFSLVEVTISLSILALVFAGVIAASMQSLQRAEWSAYSLAAQSLASQRLEQIRAAKWDTLAVPQVDRVQEANFPAWREILDVPLSGTNIVWATNYSTIRWVDNDPPYKLVRVECVWAYHNGRVFTNSITTYRSPDQ